MLLRISPESLCFNDVYPNAMPWAEEVLLLYASDMASLKEQRARRVAKLRVYLCEAPKNMSTSMSYNMYIYIYVYTHT